MKHIVLFLSAAILSGVCAAWTKPAAALGGGEAIAAPQEPQVLTRLDDAVGGYFYDGCAQRRIKLQELVLGITQDRLLGVARYVGLTDDGTYVEHTDLAPYAELINNTDSLRGFYILDYETEERVWIESGAFFLDANRTFGFYALTGLSADGTPFDWTANAQECCALVTTTKCVKEPSDPCTVSCPGPGAACVCNPPAGGSGSCMQIMSQRCQGSCDPVSCDAPVGSACHGPITNCHCE